MASQWDYIRHAVGDVDDVNRGLMDSVLRIIGSRGNGQLTSMEHAAIMLEMDSILNATYGLSPDAARQSTMFRAILRNTDAAAEGPIRGFFEQLEIDVRRRDPTGQLWSRIEGAMRNGGWGPNDRMAEYYRALNGPHAEKMRMLRSGHLDPQRKWVPRDKWTTKRGYRLSDRVWKSGRSYRGRITRELRSGIQRGDGPITIARNLERYLNPDLAARYSPGGRVLKPGRPGGQATTRSRVLARTEVKHMHHQATIESMGMLPPEIGAAMQWALSNRHERIDICDVLAAQNLFGLAPGVYPIDKVPGIPHPQCLCALIPWFPPGVDLVDVIARKYGF